MKWFLVIALMAANAAMAQVSENFDDGDFSANPPWNGNTASFVINMGELQSSSATADHRFFLSTPNDLAHAEWSFRVRLDFSTSSLNYVDVYILSNNEDLVAAGNTGYFVRVGYTQDEVSLYRKDATGEVKLVDGVDGSVAGSTNELTIRVSRGSSNRFMLFRDVGSTGNFFAEGSAVDSVYTVTNYFGILVRQGSSSFFNKHFFDDIIVTPFMPDTIPPAFVNVLASTDSTLDVEFSEPVEPITALSPLNYSVSGSVGLAKRVDTHPFDPNIFKLTFFNPFPIREELRLSVTGITDLSGNMMVTPSFPFVYFKPSFGDVIIHEIMADPSPPQRLPDAEWIEVANNSGLPISLSRWRFCKSATCVTLPPYILPADSTIVLCAANRAAELNVFTPVLGLPGFPSLNNDGDQLSIYSPQGKVIHAVKYSDSWYGSDFKKQGGFSLEMIDKGNYCVASENWKGSESAFGGTPGKINSVAGNTADETSPYAVRVFVTDSTRISVIFNETIDSLSAVNAYYNIDPVGIRPATISVEAPALDRAELVLPSPLERNQVYELKVSGVKDCSANVAPEQSIRFGIPETPTAGEILINEILFNPSSGGVDFVELYNNSDKVFSMKDLMIANRNDAGELNSVVNISREGILFLPGQFMVITESSEITRRQYVCGPSENFITLFTPSMPDDKGEVVILNSAGDYIDEVNYDKDWHFPLITNDEGISLERISYSGASVDNRNWHSAASTHGFATPGLENSQHRSSLAESAEIEVDPKIISPNGDGKNDFAFINYGLAENGYTANLTIFDSGGHLVRLLCRNDLCGARGFWKWDGLGDNGKVLLPGVYIIFIELLNPSGSKAVFKKAVVLSGETL